MHPLWRIWEAAVGDLQLSLGRGEIAQLADLEGSPEMELIRTAGSTPEDLCWVGSLAGFVGPFGVELPTSHSGAQPLS